MDENFNMWERCQGELVPPLCPWEQLPHTAVQQIYQYLGDADRVSMAMVCKPWYQVFGNPALWRRRIVEFDRRKTKREIKMDDIYKAQTALPLASGKMAIRFAQKFSTYLQELNIFVKLTLPAEKEIARDFVSLLELLDDSKLLKLKISFCLFGSLGSQGQHFLRALNRLLQNQRCLKEAWISSTVLDLDEGLLLLRCLANASGDTIEILSLKDIFRSRAGVLLDLDGREVEEFEKFHQLGQIKIDYQMLSDELVRLWARGFPGLTFIKLWADTDTPGRVISSEAWNDLVSSHPSLLVELCVNITKDMEEMFVILSPSIPLYKLVWELQHGVSTELQLTDFFLRVANYHNTITHLCVNVHGKCENVDETSVQNILSNCTNLLSYKCRYLKVPETGTDTWSLSQC